MNKNVLILCTGNSCRSIIAEALINSQLEGIIAHSSGVKPNGRVNPNAQKILEEHGIWKEEYCSKTLDKVEHLNFDLVVTVCDHANETCPTFPNKTKIIHVSFEDPDGKEYEVFKETYENIKKRLLPIVKKELLDN
jgi:arsenate reductase